MTVGFSTTEMHEGDQKLLSPDARFHGSNATEMRWRPGLPPPHPLASQLNSTRVYWDTVARWLKQIQVNKMIKVNEVKTKQ